VLIRKRAARGFDEQPQLGASGEQKSGEQGGDCGRRLVGPSAALGEAVADEEGDDVGGPGGVEGEAEGRGDGEVCVVGSVVVVLWVGGRREGRGERVVR
jgi:hypothetical protein